MTLVDFIRDTLEHALRDQQLTLNRAARGLRVEWTDERGRPSIGSGMVRITAPPTLIRALELDGCRWCDHAQHADEECKHEGPPRCACLVFSMKRIRGERPGQPTAGGGSVTFVERDVALEEVAAALEAKARGRDRRGVLESVAGAAVEAGIEKALCEAAAELRKLKGGGS